MKFSSTFPQLSWFGAIRMRQQIFLYIFVSYKHDVSMKALNNTSSFSSKTKVGIHAHNHCAISLKPNINTGSSISVIDGTKSYDRIINLVGRSLDSTSQTDHQPTPVHIRVENMIQCQHLRTFQPETFLYREMCQMLLNCMICIVLH